MSGWHVEADRIWWEGDQPEPIAYLGEGMEEHGALIAASPDLLAALEGMVEMATHHMMEPKERREILRNARAAIAKAKGEQ